MFCFFKESWINDGRAEHSGHPQKDGILKTLSKLAGCLKRPLSNIKVDWKYKNINFAFTWKGYTMNQDQLSII